MTKTYRYLLALALCVCLFAAFTASAHAASPAREALENAVNQVLDELDDPALKNPDTRDAILNRVEKTISGIFDFTELSLRTVGPGWNGFSDDQKNRFATAFEVLLRETYLEKLAGYDGEKVIYQGETASSKGDKVEIKTIVDLKDKPVPVAYRMLEKNKRWVVYDVIIEGVSMVQNYRTQFQDLLASGDTEALIKRIHDKAEELRSYNKKQQTGN